MVFDYSYKPEKQDIVVSLKIDGVDDLYTDFIQELEEYTNIYNITFLSQGLEDELVYDKYKNSLFKHLLILAEANDIGEAIEEYKKLFDIYNCISIAFVYSSEEKMQQAENKINTLKKLIGDKINFLRPDTCENGKWFSSKLKILDNAICDTIRIKYNPTKLHDDIPDISLAEKNFFVTASQLYDKYKLYHRSASDGFFALRHNNGILITATKTYKDHLDCERISYIHSYDETNNTLVYSGKYLPSSDGVEAWVVFQKNPEVTAIIHTHASDLYTRNAVYQNKIKIPKGTYGDPIIGEQINECIKNYLNDFLILEEHGEYFTFTFPCQQIGNALENLLLTHTKDGYISLLKSG